MKQILVDASQEESIDLNKNKDIAILALKAFWSKPRPYIYQVESKLSRSELQVFLAPAQYIHMTKYQVNSQK